MRILLVEDFPEFSSAIKAAFDALGCTTIVAEALDEARGVIRDETQKVDGILLDHDLPAIKGFPDCASGAEVAKEALAKNPKLPIVGISAVWSNNQHLLSVGAFMALPKAGVVAAAPDILFEMQRHAGMVHDLDA